MSVETNKAAALEDKIRRKITWYRVPLMLIAFAGILGFIFKMKAFWYGVPVVILGELIQMWATSHLHKDKHFTISGPYSHLRNPMYFGRFFVGLGVFIMTWNPIMVISYVVIYAVYAHMRVNREESRLREIFKPNYQHYCSEIHRWLPSFKAYSKSESRRAKWSQVCANHEQIVAIGILFALVLIYFRIDLSDKVAFLQNWHWKF